MNGNGKKQDGADGDVELQCQPDEALANSRAREGTLLTRTILSWAKMVEPLHPHLAQSLDTTCLGKGRP